MINAANCELREEEEQLLENRDKMRRAAEKIKQANAEIEREIEEILKVDEVVRKAIEVRDRKASPVISQTRAQHAIYV